jgi:hypothetical protein
MFLFKIGISFIISLTNFLILLFSGGCLLLLAEIATEVDYSLHSLEHAALFFPVILSFDIY